jgi:hypothetical protein
MRQVSGAGPMVVAGQLTGVREGPLRVGSPAWQEWLGTVGPDHRAFTFPAQGGGLHRACREWRREQPYWYVKVRVGTAIKRFYLGRPADVDAARLEDVGVAIAAARHAVVNSGHD